MKTSPRKFNYIFLVALAVGISILLLGAISETVFLIGIGLLIAFGSFVFRAIFFRCPYCGYYLGRRSGFYCPHCKREIE